MKGNSLETILSNQKLSNWVLKVLVGLMMACASVSFSQFAQRITTSSNPSILTTPLNLWYLPILVLAISIEVFATRNKLDSLDGVEKWIYHIAEWIVFTIILKMVIYLIIGTDHLGADLQSWEQNPASFFVFYSANGRNQMNDQAAFLPMLALLFIAWLLVSDISKEMDVLQSELTDFKWEIGKLDNDRQAARQRIAERLFMIGGVMIVATMAARINIKGFLPDNPAFQASLINVVVYFFLALVFLSQTQFAFLRGRWFWSQTPVAPHIGRNWIRYSLIFFGIIAIIAVILPTSYTLNLLQLIQVVVNFFIQIGFFIVSLFAYLFGLVASLFGVKRPTDTDNTPLPTPTFVPPPAAGGPLPWLELLKSILFWAIFIGIVGFAIVHFIRQNSFLLSGALKVPGLGWIIKAIKSFWVWLAGTGKQISTSVSSGLRRIFQTVPKSISREMQQLFNFRQLSPRQQVVFYYLKLVERSKKSGVNRMPHQTPNQFASDLDQVIPEVREEVDQLTGSFIEARYSQHPVGAQQTTLAQRLWRKIVKSLKPTKPGA